MKADLICYDFDGTLCNTMPDIAESINVTLENMGYNRIPVKRVRGFVGNGIAKLVARSLSFSIAQETGSPLNEQEQAKFGTSMQAYYMNHLTDKSDLYDGVRDVLEYYKDTTQIIVSNKPVKMIDAMIKHFGIDKYFKLVVGGDSVDVCKPDVKVWSYIKKELNLDENTTAVMVGDSKPDIEFGKNAGIRTVAVTYGYNDVPVLVEAGADVLVNSFHELKSVI